MHPLKVIKPTFLVNEKICRSNIARMMHKCRDSRTIFRPHFKTHQSAEIGQWFAEAGVDRITVSSVTMAEYFANTGWKNILIAFPVNIREIEKIRELSSRVELHLQVESLEVASFLKEHIKDKAGIYIKIDTGYHRTGILPIDIEKITEILAMIKSASQLTFSGFLTHSGHTYNAKSPSKIREIYNDSFSQLLELKNHFKDSYPNLILSIGDTPGCSIVQDFKGVDEIRPGNFIFYDMMQYDLGSCDIADIAVALACPVIAVHTARKEIIIYGGAVHLSKEFLIDSSGRKTFGSVVELTSDGWSGRFEHSYVSALSQEHGVISATEKIIMNYQPGDLLGVIPVHSCITASLQKEYLNLEGGTIRNFNH